jgi:hypothetical protein
MGQLINLSENDLLKTPNLGHRSLNEIKMRIKEAGFELRSTSKYVTTFDFELKPERVQECGDVLIKQCHGLARKCGWWPEIDEWMEPRRNVAEMLCLIHSEISEAMEGHRKGLMDDKLPHRPMLEVELADAVIRIFDMAGGLKLDVAGAMAEKLQYNATREDHKPENRRADSGKKY